MKILGFFLFTVAAAFLAVTAILNFSLNLIREGFASTVAVIIVGEYALRIISSGRRCVSSLSITSPQ